MREQFEKKELEQAYRTVRTRIVKYATVHLPGVDLRTATALQLGGVLSEQESSSLDPVVVEVLLSRRPDLCMIVSHGPHIFYRENKDNLTQYVFEVASGFFESSTEIRNASLDHILRGVGRGDEILLDRTREILVAEREALSSETMSTWKQAALKCYDALNEDMLYHLGGVRQALSVQFEEGIRRHMERILRPSQYSVELAVEQACAGFESEESRAKILAKISSAPNLEEACDEFLLDAGFLPTTDSLTFSSFIFAWVEKRSNEGDIWERIWEWALHREHPAAVSMVCAFFLQHPQMLPKGGLSRIWTSLLGLLSGRDTDEAARATKLVFKLQEALAFNNLTYVHTAFPSLAEARTSVFAWWLAGRVSLAVSSSPRSMAYLLSEFLDPAGQRVVFFSQIGSVPIEWSSLGMITRYRGNPWTLSLLSLFGSRSETLLHDEMPEELLQRLAESTAVSILDGCALIEEASQPLIQLSFDSRNVEKLALTLAGREKASKFATELPVLYSRCVGLTTAEGCLEQLMSVASLNETDQLLVAKMLRHTILARKVSFGNVWKIVSDVDWKRRFFADLSVGVIAMFFEALAVGPQVEPGPWTLELPHIYASACEAEPDNREKVEALFLFAVVSSVQSHSCSAVVRLVSGDRRPSLERAIEDATRLLTDEMDGSPAWIRARSHALLPYLRGE